MAAASTLSSSHLPLQARGFAVGCPCWWLLLQLSFHPTSPLQAGGVCSCSPMLVAAASTFSSSHLPFLGRWRLQLPAPVGGCCFYSLFIPPPLSRQVVFTASCPCWWLLLLLSLHPTFRFLGRWCSQLPSLVGGCCFYSLFIPPPFPRQVVLAAACPCWWLLLLLSLHPTSLLQAAWCLQLAAPVGGCCFYSLFIPPPLSRRVVFAAAHPCWWLLLLLSLHPTSLS